MFHFTGGAHKGKGKKAPETLIVGKEAGELSFSYFFYLHEASAVQKCKL